MSSDGPIYRMTRGGAFVIYAEGIDARLRAEESPGDCWEDNSIRIACNVRGEDVKPEEPEVPNLEGRELLREGMRIAGLRENVLQTGNSEAGFPHRLQREEGE